MYMKNGSCTTLTSTALMLCVAWVAKRLTTKRSICKYQNVEGSLCSQKEIMVNDKRQFGRHDVRKEQILHHFDLSLFLIIILLLQKQLSCSRPPILNFTHRERELQFKVELFKI